MIERYAALRGRIVEKYGTQQDFCEALGVSQTSVSKKMSGKAGFSQKDIKLWCKLLDINLGDVGRFFYK